MNKTEVLFMNKVELIPFTTCWIWTGAVMNKNNPRLIPAVKFNGKVQNARRVSFELFVGEIWDDSLRVTSGCGTDICVNPEHVQLLKPHEIGAEGRVTQQKKAAARTHFGCGHEISDENTIYNGRQERHCRECNRAQKREAKRARAYRPRPHTWVENRGGIYE